MADPIRIMGVEHERAGKLLARLPAAAATTQCRPTGVPAARPEYDWLAVLELDAQITRSPCPVVVIGPLDTDLG